MLRELRRRSLRRVVSAQRGGEEHHAAEGGQEAWLPIFSYGNDGDAVADDGGRHSVHEAA